MRIKRESIDRLREKADILEVASEFTALRRQGTRYTGLCPYPDHNEKTPSFSVSPEDGLYYCFGCQRGGDSIKLLSDLKNLPFIEAVELLAEQSGLTLEFEDTPGKNQLSTPRRRELHRCLAAATAYYHKYLLKSDNEQVKKVRQYIKSRGIRSETVRDFRVGYAPYGDGGFLEVAGRLGFEREVLEGAGLVSGNGGERFRGRLMFPIFDLRGRVAGFGGRVVGEGQPKYLNSPEGEIFNKRRLLYGLSSGAEQMRRERFAVVVEGYTDVLMLHQAGIKTAVATLGTATTQDHLRTLSRYADTIYLLFDPDAAGEKAIQRVAVTGAELKLDLRVLRLPADPADWMLHHSADDFRRALGGATPVLEYGIRRITDEVRGAGAVARSRVVPEVREFVSQISDPVLCREAVRLASEALGVGYGELYRPRASYGAAGQSAQIPSEKSPLQDASRKLLAMMLGAPELAAELLRCGVEVADQGERVVLSEEDFEKGSPEAQLFTLMSENSGEDLGALLSDERARPLMNLIGELSTESEKLYISQVAMVEAYLRLAILSAQHRKRVSEDLDEKQRLHNRISTLNQTLRHLPIQSP